jgi:hypothetical protein
LLSYDVEIEFACYVTHKTNMYTEGINEFRVSFRHISFMTLTVLHTCMLTGYKKTKNVTEIFTGFAQDGGQLSATRQEGLTAAW